MLEFRILGPLEVSGDAGPLRLGGPKQRATLAILLLNANQVVSIDRLADDLYAGDVPVTAVTQVQRQISELRKALGQASGIETRPPGYVIRVSPDQLDLARFERWTEEAGQVLSRGEAERARDLLRDALALWRGAPLADVEHELFAQIAVERLGEIRLAALEQRIEAELSLGRDRELVGELEALVAEHPFRERVTAQLMLALYRSGRQADALAAFRRTRTLLVDEFGIEPATALRQLERAILEQDPSLDLLPGRRPGEEGRERVILVLPFSDDRLDAMLELVEPLTRVPATELIVARMVRADTELGSATAALNARRSTLGVRTRTAAFTTSDPSADVVRLATTNDVDLVLLDAPYDLDAERLPNDVEAVLDHAPADVGVVAWSTVGERGEEGVFVPFAGGENDWAALELAAWLAVASGAPLRLIGTKANPDYGRRDASRLLADASLAVQRVAGVVTEPILVAPTTNELIDAVAGATVVVMGLSPRWRQEGIGALRQALVRDCRAPTLLVHSGPRPSGLAPRESRTRYTWTMGIGADLAVVAARRVCAERIRPAQRQKP